jgi:hypothetical protein
LFSWQPAAGDISIYEDDYLLTPHLGLSPLSLMGKRKILEVSFLPGLWIRIYFNPDLDTDPAF